MIYRIYGYKDTTLYEPTLRTEQNTGRDEILEVTKFFDDDTNGLLVGNSRILAQFDLMDISQSIVDGDISGSIKYYLRMVSAEESEVQSEYTLNVYQVSSSWSEGIGQFYDNPKNTHGASWVNRFDGTAWNVNGTTYFNGSPVARVPESGIVIYEGFADGTGSAYLTESINSIYGGEPYIYSQNEKLVVSASKYSGTTVVFPAYLSASVSYGMQFQVDPGGFNDIAFRVEDPNGVLKTEEDYENMVGRITSPSTQSFVMTAEDSGIHQLRFTFFDSAGTEASVGTFDEVYVYQTNGDLLRWDTFTPDEGFFELRNVVNETLESNVRMFASESKLNLYARNGGGDASHPVILEKDVTYYISCSINPGDLTSIDFTLYDPNGLKTREGITGLVSSFTSQGTQKISFTPYFSGEHIFSYTFYNQNSNSESGSIDDFKIGYITDVISNPITDAGYYHNIGGGTWYTASVNNTTYQQTFTKYNADLNLEITEYVNDWITGSRSNDGLIIKRPPSQESSALRFGSSKFFSNESHTIYVPTLEVRWDNSIFETGSLEALTADDITIYLKNLDAEYKELSKARLRLVGREKYPTRTFTNINPYTTIKYLPETTYYQVRDAETNLVLIPYDTTYTKVSCDSTGNYFDFWFNTLQPERYYQFEFRVDRDSKKQYFDGNVFKVIR